MSITAIAIIFGIVYPIYCWLAGVLTGSQSEPHKEANQTWIKSHPASSIIGAIMSLAVPIAYWILVIVYLV